MKPEKLGLQHVSFNLCEKGKVDHRETVNLDASDIMLKTSMFDFRQWLTYALLLLVVLFGAQVGSSMPFVRNMQ